MTVDGLAAFKKPKGQEWEKGAEAIWGKEEKIDLTNYDPWARYKTSNLTPIRPKDNNLSIMRDNMAYMESEQGKRELLQPFDSNGRVNQEFAQVYGDSAIKNAQGELHHKGKKKLV